MSKRKKILLATICPFHVKEIQLALYYLKAYFMKNSGYASSLVDIDIEIFTNKDKVESIARKISQMRPDIVGFSCYVWNSTDILRVAKILKKANPGLILILGGSDVSARAEEILSRKKYIDIVVRGEGEETFKELVQGLLHAKTDLCTIKGISYRLKNQLFRNPDRPPIPDLDNIPSPYLEGLVDFKRYRKWKYMPDVPMETMRGCHFRCHYCYYHKDFPRLRYFSLARVKREFKYILARNPPRIHLMDSTFNMNPQRAKKILRIFARYNRKSKLHLELRAELLDSEMVRLLHQAPAYVIEIGVQTANPRSLKLINRTLKRGIFRSSIRLLNKYRINYELQLIEGLPGDSYDDFKKSLDWVFGLCPPKVGIYPLQILPGTYLRQHAARFGIVYDADPPYVAHQNAAISAKDLKRVAQLKLAVLDLMQEDWTRQTMRFLKRRLAINFSDLFEEWLKFKKKCGLRGYLNNLRGKKQGSAALNWRVNKILAFMKYLCVKYGNSSQYEEMRRRLIIDSALYSARESRVEKIKKERSTFYLK